MQPRSSARPSSGCEHMQAVGRRSSALVGRSSAAVGRFRSHKLLAEPLWSSALGPRRPSALVRPRPSSVVGPRRSSPVVGRRSSLVVDRRRWSIVVHRCRSSVLVVPRRFSSRCCRSSTAAGRQSWMNEGWSPSSVVNSRHRWSPIANRSSSTAHLDTPLHSHTHTHHIHRCTYTVFLPVGPPNIGSDWAWHGSYTTEPHHRKHKNTQDK